MISPDRALVSALLKEEKKGLKHLNDSNFSESMLADFDCKKALKFVKEFNDNFDEMPSRETLEEKFPGLIPETVPQGVLFYLNEIDKRHQFSIIKNMNTAIKSQLDSKSVDAVLDGVEMAKQLVIDAARKLNLESTQANTFDITQTVQERIDAYLARKLNDGITGIPTAWLPLTMATRGWQNGHTYCIAAHSGVGKTFTLTLNALTARKKGYIALMFTQEMSQVEIATRFDAVDSQTNYDRLLSGKLTPEEESNYMLYLASLKDDANGVPFFVNEKAGGKGIDYIVSVIEDIKPDIVFIDNIYLFAKSLDYKDILDVSMKLKNTAQKLGIPIVFCTQLNDDGSLQFAKHIKNDVSGSYKMYKLDPHKKRKFVDEKSRDSAGAGEFAVNWDFDNMEFDHDPDFILNSDTNYEDVLDDLY